MYTADKGKKKEYSGYVWMKNDDIYEYERHFTTM